MKNLLFLAFSFCFSNFNSNAVLESQFKIGGSISSDFVNPGNPTDPFKIEKLVALISGYLYEDKVAFSGVNRIAFNYVKVKFPSFESLSKKPLFFEKNLSPSIKLARFNYSESSVFNDQSDFLKNVGPEGSVSFLISGALEEDLSGVENLIYISVSCDFLSLKGIVNNLLVYRDKSFFNNTPTFNSVRDSVRSGDLVCESVSFLGGSYDVDRCQDDFCLFNGFFSKVKRLSLKNLFFEPLLSGFFDGNNNPDIIYLDLRLFNCFSGVRDLKNGFVSNLPGLKEVDMTVMFDLKTVRGVLFENCPNLEVIFMTEYQFENFYFNVWEPKRACIKMKNPSFVQEVE